MNLGFLIMNNLRHFRKLKGLSQDKISKLAGCTVRYYQDLEYGKRMPNVYLAIALCDVLGVVDIREIFPPQATESSKLNILEKSMTNSSSK